MISTPAAVLPSSLWAATAEPAPNYRIQQTPSSADVVVIGGGFTGLSTALHLARGKTEVVVLDASEPGWGASGRNGGQIIAGLKHDPDRLDHMFGERLGPAITTTMGASAELTRTLIETYRIECHAVFSGWIQGAHGRKGYERLVVPRCSQWQARGVAGQLLDSDAMMAKLGSAKEAYYGGWLDPRGGVLQPLSYARGLATACLAEGAVISAQTPVRRLRQDGGHWLVDTDTGTIRANKVVVATNAYTDDLWPGLRQTVVPVSSFQIATYPLDPTVAASILPGQQGVADTRRLLLYFRKDHADRLIMGGRSPVDDHPVLSDATPLRAAIRTIFPQAGDHPVQFVWSGKVAITKDTMPHLHVLAPGLFTALGCNGRGVAACTMIGKVLAALVDGHPADDLPLPVTSPDPYRLHRARRLGVLALSQYYRLLDRLDL